MMIKEARDSSISAQMSIGILKLALLLKSRMYIPEYNFEDMKGLVSFLNDLHDIYTEISV